MFRLLTTLRKELLILRRDKGGLAILFLMPMALIIIMSLIQDAPFRDFQEMRVPLVLVNNDSGEFGRKIQTGLETAGIFQVKSDTLEADQLKALVKKGDAKIGILIPAGASELLQKKVNNFVQQKLDEAGLGSSNDSLQNDSELDSLQLSVYFAPDTKKSFKASILASLKQTSSMLETELVIHTFYHSMNSGTVDNQKESRGMGSFVEYKEITTADFPQEAKQMNSVQHNVPAWTIFGMFFIVISLSGSIIKEREDGSYTRIRTMPGSYLVVMAGKILAYLLVCCIQAALMLLVGIFLLPHLGLPSLIIGSNWLALAVVTLAAGLAATGYGSMVGTLFRTHQQSSTFGSVSIVILAALGGIWVPVYVMPESIRIFAEYSPLYWGLTAYHKLFLDDAGLLTVFPFVLKLLLFFLVAIAVSFIYNRRKEAL